MEDSILKLITIGYALGIGIVGVMVTNDYVYLTLVSLMRR